MSGDPEQEYFSDGMTDDLITDLSKISGLFVIARNSVFTYKGKPVKIEQVGRELGVRYVLEGSVRRAKNLVRINAQLIDAKTGGHLWADRYDGKMDNIFTLQDKITNEIVSALAVKLIPSEQEQVARQYTNNKEAYDAFLNGRRYYKRWTRDDTPKAISYLKKAVELDPNYGQAYAILADIYWNTSTRWTGMRWPNSCLMARKYMRLAMRNPGPFAYSVSGEMKARLRLHQEALSETEHALALAPNDSFLHGEMSWVLNMAGKPKKAIEFAKVAIRYDPSTAWWALNNLGIAHFSLGKYEEAGTFYERSLTHNPDFYFSYIYLAASYAHLGRDKEAQEALDNYYRSKGGWKPDLRVMMYWRPYKDPEVAERMAEGLLKAGMRGEPSGYHKILEENRLTGEEIRKLVFGQKIRTYCQMTDLGYIYFNRTKNGTFEQTGYGAGGAGKSRIEGDMLCDKWDTWFDGLEFCGTVFRNPEGTSDTKDEYLYVTDFQICELHPVE